jgi:hypothetical protein
MQTGDFIRVLVADHRPGAASVGRGLALALAIGFAVSALAFTLALGPRSDIAAAAATPRFLLKFVETLLLAATAALLALRLVQPAARIPALAILAAPALLAVAVTIELALVPPAQWPEKLIGSNSLVCLTAVPLLSLPILAAALFGLRRGAAAHATLAGAAAGLLASGLAATLYAMHCTDDSPLFVALWYSIAIAVVTALGAFAGKRLLRW